MTLDSREQVAYRIYRIGDFLNILHTYYYHAWDDAVNWSRGCDKCTSGTTRDPDGMVRPFTLLIII
eukprot:scaffold184705_cov24-Cyclotella_meneghiniana.AAC.3